MSEKVNHPSHYCTENYECIEVEKEVFGIEAVKAAYICNAFEYLWRHQKKNGKEDIEKAVWYLNKYIELEDKQNEAKEEGEKAKEFLDRIKKQTELAVGTGHYTPPSGTGDYTPPSVKTPMKVGII